MEYKVIILAGQSNTNGEAALSGFTTIQKSKKTKVLSWYAGQLQYYEVGINNRKRSLSEQKAGTDVELATQIQANYNGKVILLKIAEGSTGTYAGQPWNTSTTIWYTSMYQQLMIAIENFELFFAENFPTDTFVYTCMGWNQGEQDALDSINSLAYQTNCTAIWNAIKSKIGLPNLPIYDWKLSDLNIQNGTYKANVNSAKVTLNSLYGNGGVLYNTDAADGYSFQDGYHYDAATYTLAGLNLYNDIIANGHL